MLKIIQKVESKNSLIFWPRVYVWIVASDYTIRPWNCISEIWLTDYSTRIVTWNHGYLFYCVCASIRVPFQLDCLSSSSYHKKNCKYWGGRERVIKFMCLWRVAVISTSWRTMEFTPNQQEGHTGWSSYLTMSTVSCHLCSVMRARLK